MTQNELNYIQKEFPWITKEQTEQFSALSDLYTDWNAKINVISRKDIDNLFVHHVLHSLSIGKFIRFKDRTEILDVGTGGGFPGIPLAVLFPHANFHLIDRIAKKIKVVNAVKDTLKLTNVTAEQLPCEEDKQQYDFIVSRAVTNLPDFLKITKNKIRKKSFNDIKNGILYLKGDTVTEELAGYKGKYDIIRLKDYFSDEFFQTKTLVHLPL